jgi:GT2 family glycosyltransferase
MVTAIYSNDNSLVISVVIPTYNRAEDLRETLSSILKQTAAAKEIIVVDDSDANETELLIDSLKDVQRSVDLIYVRNEGDKSTSAARNLGIRMARGNIVQFLDDDVILDRDYLSEIVKVFESLPGAMGVQGWMVQKSPKGLIKAILRFAKRAFYLTHTVENGCSVLPSTNVTYPHILRGTIPCEWLHGCNFSLRRSVLSEFSFDEKLKEYAWKEDLDFTYRIHQKYPGTLYIAPKARLIHKASVAGRRPLEIVAYLKDSYELYIFFKDFDRGIKDRIIFIWSKFGALLFLLFAGRSKSIGDVATELLYWFKAQSLCIKHLEEIKKGDFEFIFKKSQ